ncbi:MAG: prenyltransferase/squalene oxidase repeat-containing protein [Planctomycetota bacterium]
MIARPLAALAAAVALAFPTPSIAAESATVGASATKLLADAMSFLADSQAEDGSWSSFAGSGVTSLVGTGLLRNGSSAQDPVVAKALEYVLSHVKPTGAIHLEGTNYRNYETCLAIMFLTEANVGGRYDEVLANAEAFINDLQWDESEDQGPESLSYGGAGYGRHGRPDMSNTGFFLEAKQSLGRGEEDPAVRKALAFISRCQNLETEYNTTEWAAKIQDGGFYYTAAAGGQSQAGETDNGGLRSYGSMTYVGLKSMLYAGVTASDPRVKAARAWIGKNYTLDQNPGMGTSGLFYYYHVFAKALDTLGEAEIIDPSGTSHNWRAELVERLAKTQNADGSWTNSNKRWMETDPNLVTAYVLLALAHAAE